MTFPVFWSMALLTVQRSPSSSGPGLTEPDGVAVSPEEKSPLEKAQNRQRRCFGWEKYIVELIRPDDGTLQAIAVGNGILLQNISECYFAMKGAALVLPQNESMIAYRKSSSNGGNISTNGGDIQKHLQSMFYLLRPEDTLKMAVKLESFHVCRTRYLVVVSCTGSQNMEENCLLGIDCNDSTRLGLVLPVWADVKITLDGDGGFSVTSNSRHHIFKPVSVQAMWSALQTLHKASEKATECNYFLGGVSHSWIEYYENKINSDRSCLNEWHAMDDLESRRPPSPDYRKFHQRDREVIERDIKGKLREVMMTVDLDEVTSKHIRTRLEQDLQMDLQEYKSFIDQEMLTIMGQMDTSTEIFDHLYLGSEWNASNLEELQRNGVGYILNVTREIDNFFPGMFDYLNIRVYDEEGTELLKHWDTTYRFITDAKEKGSKVLVHCKMGVSRSASVVIAYIMKANNWKLHKAFDFVKDKRNCVQPNQSFMKQLETYQGILDASNHRHNTLWRSKSENSLKKQEDETTEPISVNTAEKSEEQPTVPDLYLEIQSLSPRPKSWSPDENVADRLFSENVTDSPDVTKNHVLLRPACLDGVSYSVSPNKALHLPLPASQQSEPIRFAIGSDDSPVSEGNEAVEIDDGTSRELEDNDDEVNNVRLVKRVSSIKDRINELESQAQLSESKQGSNRDWLDLPENTGLVLNLANQFESVSKSTPASPVEEENKCELSVIIQSESEPGERQLASDIQGREPVMSQTKPFATKLQAVLVHPETWNDKSVEILRANSESLLTSTPDEAVEIRRHSTNDLKCCKSESDVIMRLRVNNQSKDLNCVNSPAHNKDQVESATKRDVPSSVNRQISFRAEDILNPFPISRSQTQEITNSNAKPSLRVVASNADLPVKLNRSPQEAPKHNDVFSVHLDNIFDKEEFTAKLPSHNGVNFKFDGDCLVCDSTTSTQTLGLQSTISEVKAISSKNRVTDIVEKDLKPRLLLSDLIQPHSRQTEANCALKVGEKTCEEDCLLKRASSLDGSLPSRSESLINAQQHAWTANGQEVAPSQDIVLASGIQRSQSLRNDTTSCKHCNDTPKVLRIHGPKPYKSPSEKQAPCILDGATIMANGMGRCERSDGVVVHYASAPLLYKESLHEYPTVPKAAASQPNITVSSGLITTTSKSSSKPPLKLDLHNYNDIMVIEATDSVLNAERTSPIIVSNNNNVDKPVEKEVPLCSGIVKQHKEVLESKIASSSVPSWPLQKTPPTHYNNTGISSGGSAAALEISEQPFPLTTAESKQSCDKAEEWKILQSKLHQQMQLSTLEPQDDGSPPGKVKRMTRQMELATSSSFPTTVVNPSVSTTVHLSTELTPDLIIVDQNGKEITPDLPHQSIFSTGTEATSTAISLNNVICSVTEDKSVKSLVGKFEVKEKPSRQRYFSETEVENLAWTGTTVSNPESIATDDKVGQENSLTTIPCNQMEPCSCHNKRSVECDMGHCHSAATLNNCSLTREPANIKIESLPERQFCDNQNVVGLCKKERWTMAAPNSHIPAMSDDELISSDKGVPPRKVRKAQGKSHPLSKLQNSNKQRLVSPFYYTM